MKRLLKDTLLRTLLLAIGVAFTAPALAISLGDLNNRIKNLQTTLNNVKNTGVKTASGIDQMNPAGVGDMVALVETNLSSLSPDALSEIAASGVTFSAKIQEKKALLASFLDANRQCTNGTPCVDFKTTLLGLLVAVNTKAREAQVILNPSLEPVSVVNENLLELLDKIPGEAFLPLWVATKQGLLIDNINGMLTVSYENVGPRLPPIYARYLETVNDGSRLVRHDGHYSSNSMKIDSYNGQAIKVASSYPTLSFVKRDCVRSPVRSSDTSITHYPIQDAKMYAVFAVVAKIMKSIIATMPDEVKLKVAIWGWAGTDVPAMPVSKPLTEMFDWTATLMDSASSTLNSKLDSCERAYNQMLIMKATPGVPPHETVWDGFISKYDQ